MAIAALNTDRMAGRSSIMEARTLAMTSDAPTPVPASQAPAPTAAGAQATLAAEAVQPPSTAKILIGSVLRGALSGSGLMFSANKFFPGALPAAVNFAARFLPFIPALTGPVGALVALGAGAAIGGIFGLIGGLRSAKKAREEFAAAQEQAQSPANNRGPVPVGDPLVIGPDGRPIPVDPATNAPISTTPVPAGAVPTNPVMTSAHRATTSRSGRSAAAAQRTRGARSTHVVKSGDTLGAIAKRHKTSVAALLKANPRITNPNHISVGQRLRVA